MAYHGATICYNGHVVSKCDANFQKHCSKCGKQTYSFCLNCKSPIHGLIKIDGVFFANSRPYSKPLYCYECGSPYPWTQYILNSAVELLSLDNSLDEESKELIKNAIPNLLTDTPATPIAVAQYNKGLEKADTILTNSITALLTDFLCSSAKKLLFL